MNISMIPLTVIGTKYDVFAKSNEPAQKKLICAALRYICHTNGCDLIFTSVNEQGPLKVFKNIISWHTFRQLANQDKPQTNENEEGNALEE